MKAPLFFSRIKSDRSRLDRKRRSRIASFEALEGRALLTGYTWNSASSGDFSNAADWNSDTNPVVHAVPGPGDDANIPEGDFTISVTQNETVNSIQGAFGGGVSVLSGTLTVGNSTTHQASIIDGLAVASGASFVTAGGTTTLENGNVINGNLNTAAGATLIFSDSASFPGALETGTTLTGTGTFEVASYLFIDTTITAPTNLQLASGNSDGIDGTGTLTVPSGATLDWQSGSMQGLGGVTNIAAGGTLLIDGPSTGAFYLSDRALNNAGTATYSSLAQLNLSGQAVLSNSGTFAITNDGAIVNAGIINNSGTLTKTSPSGFGTTTINPIFNNTGTVSATSGILNLAGAGINTGRFDDPGSAGQINITGSNYSLNAGSTYTGAGTLYLNASTNGSNGININGNLTIPNVTVNTGYLDGSGTLTVTGTLLANNAFFNLSSSLNLPSGSILAIFGAGQTTTFANLTVNDAGTTTLSGTDNISLAGTAVFNNSGTFTIASDTTGAGGNFSLNNATFYNTGSLIKTTTSGPSGLSDITGGLFINQGKVSATSGQLQLDVQGTNSGDLDSQTNATMLFTQTWNLNGGTTFTGLGLFENGNGSTSNGTLNVNASMADNRLKIYGGAVNVTAGTVFTVNVFNFLAGQIYGEGTVAIPAGGSIAFSSSSDKYIATSKIDISATANWTGTGNIDLSTGAVLFFEAGSNFNISNDQTINGGATEAVDLRGTLTKTSLTGVGTTIIDCPTNILTGGGAINLVSGNLSTSSLVNVGTITLGSQTILAVTGTYTQPNAGTLNLGIGGAPNTNLFGQLKVSSTASLNGTLNVSRANGYIPIVGAAYPIMTFASGTGNFTTFNTPNNGIAPLYSTSPQSTGYNLVASTSLPTAPTGVAIIPSQQATGSATTTAFHQPTLTGHAQPGLQIQAYQNGNLVGTGVVGSNGTFVANLLSAMAPGTYTFLIVSIDALGDYSPAGAFTFTISAPPAAPTGLSLLPADDNGGPGKTSILQPRLTGTAQAGTFVQIFEAIGNANVYIGGAYANANGTFVITPASPFSVGIHILKAVAIDAGGNYGSISSPFTLNIT